MNCGDGNSCMEDNINVTLLDGRAPLGGGAPERGNPMEGDVATLRTTSSAGLDCGDRGT